MKKIRNICIILIILIIIIIVILVILKKNMKNEEEIMEEQNLDTGIIYEENDNGFRILKDPNMFYTVINALTKYLQVLAYNSSSDIEDNPYGITTEEEQREIIMAMLDTSYKNRKDISEDSNAISLITYQYDLIPINMRVRYESNITTYIVNIYLENIDTLNLEERYYIVRIDSQNQAFSIEPVDENVNSIDEVKVDKNDEKITQNEYNQYYLETISIERIVKIYMDHFTSMALKHPDIIYDQYLDEEYKEKRFGSKEAFSEYVEKNKEEIQEMRATKYLLETVEDDNKYIVMNQYGDTYEFYEEATMIYQLRMDTYTITSDKFRETYDNSDNKYKIKMNIDKWVQMLNSRDYEHAYEVLDETFRNNNFGSEEAFEEYIKEKIPSHYNVEYTTDSNKGKTYIQQINLKDITNTSEEGISLNIIMQLQDNYNFVMSFEVLE